MKRTYRAAAIALACVLSLSPLAACKTSEKAKEEVLPPSVDVDEPTGGDSSELPDVPQEPQEPETPEEPGSPPNTPQKPEVEPIPPQEEPIKKQTALYVCCVGEKVNVRSGAGTSFSVVGQADKGSVYAVNKLLNGWYEIPYKNGKAYLYAGYAKETELEKSENEKVEAVLARGYSALGVPYVYGAVRLHDGNGNFLKGFSENKFDCSSLTQYAFYYGAGALLGTTTRAQVKQGKSVARRDLARGDCIYFTNASRQYLTGVERIGHVAIYLGDNYILHTSSDYARIEQISSARWKFYVEARRFV